MLFLSLLSLFYFRLIDNYYSSGNVLRFDDFGFNSGGIFNITVSSNKKATFTLLLANQTEYSSLRVYPYLYRSFCKNKTQALALLNKTSPKNTYDFEWNDQISSAGIYTPVLINCLNNNSLVYYRIELRFRNPSSFLDFRDEGISANDVTMSIIYCVFSFVWFINILYVRSLSINICYMFAILPPIKALSLALAAATYESLSCSDSVPNLLFYAHITANSVHLFLFSFFIGLACDGYGVFFEKLQNSSFMNYGFASFGFSLSMSLINIFDNPDIILYLVFTSLIFGFYYFNLLSQSLSTAVQIQRRTSFLIVIQKSTHILDFSLSVISCFILMVTFQCFSIVKELNHNLSDGIMELIEFAIYAFIAFFFMLRKSFNGFDSQQNCDLQADACYLSEPSNNEFVFIRKISSQ